MAMLVQPVGDTRMMTPLLPQAFWFRLAVPCRRIDGLPRAGGRERLLDLPASCRLPTTAPLDGLAAWADVRVAWNPRGLAVAVEATGAARRTRGRRPARGDGRAPGLGRYPRHPRRQPRDADSATASSAESAQVADARGARCRGQQRPIARAIADAPICRRELLQRACRAAPRGLADRAVPARRGTARLRPRDNRRLGFAYQVRLRPRAPGPVPRRRPRVPGRREPEPLVDAGTARPGMRVRSRSVSTHAVLMDATPMSDEKPIHSNRGRNPR